MLVWHETIFVCWLEGAAWTEEVSNYTITNMQVSVDLLSWYSTVFIVVLAVNHHCKATNHTAGCNQQRILKFVWKYCSYLLNYCLLASLNIVFKWHDRRLRSVAWLASKPAMYVCTYTVKNRRIPHCIRFIEVIPHLLWEVRTFILRTELATDYNALSVFSYLILHLHSNIFILGTWFCAVALILVWCQLYLIPEIVSLFPAITNSSQNEIIQTEE